MCHIVKAVQYTIFEGATMQSEIALKSSSIKPKSTSISWKDQFGYTLGDLGCVLVFSLAGSLLQKFYSDILLIPIRQITILFLVARIWDGINDPLWGKIVDVIPPTKNGRFRPWIRNMAIPLGLITLLMFMRFPGMSIPGKLIYAYATYILWDMMYTIVNIPYGSLAAVITTDAKARSTLSILRSVGAGIGGVGSMVLSGICFSKVLDDDGMPIRNEAGEIVKKMDWNILIIGVGVICLLCIICLFLCYYLTRERVPAQKSKSESRPKAEFTKIILSLIASRPFISLCIASGFLVAGQMFVQAYGLYLMADYFNKPAMNIVVTISQYAPMVVIMFFANRLTEKIGKKEGCGIGMLVAGLSYLILFFLKTNNVWIYVAFSILAGIGSSLFILQVWSFVNDALDYNYVKTKKREETATYSLFSFTRKMGQTLAGVLSTEALVWSAYEGAATIQTDATKSQLYLWATLIPAIFYLFVGITLLFWYPISKKKMAQLQIDKHKLYALEGINVGDYDDYTDDPYAFLDQPRDDDEYDEFSG